MLWALTGHPYGYYTFLRWITSGAACYFAFFTYSYEPKGWFGAYIFIALLFNPIVPIYLSKDTWKFIDIATSGYFIIAVFSIKKFIKK